VVVVHTLHVFPYPSFLVKQKRVASLLNEELDAELDYDE